MQNKNFKAVPKDENVEAAYQNYTMFKQEVDKWRQERGAHWLGQLDFAEQAPYLPVQDLPVEAITELWQRLNALVEVKASDAELKSIWEQFSQTPEGLDMLDEAAAARLIMAVRGVAGLAGRMAKDMKVPENEGISAAGASRSAVVCPVCSEVTELAILAPPNGKRIMHCTTCGFEWPVYRVGCVHCGNGDAKQHIFLKNENYPGIDMAVCKVCGQSFKEIDAREVAAKDYVWEDIRTLPLNYAAEQWMSEQARENDRLN
ncbi:MAG: formate dehydrogenase accessory protein FdhE [Syntrophomonadaceae bacterium]|nr:formate dehydrogenase accessory protein FdhE [Syntrophomonadaceae bacterium]